MNPLLILVMIFRWYTCCLKQKIKFASPFYWEYIEASLLLKGRQRRRNVFRKNGCAWILN